MSEEREPPRSAAEIQMAYIQQALDAAHKSYVANYQEAIGFWTEPESPRLPCRKRVALRLMQKYSGGLLWLIRHADGGGRKAAGRRQSGSGSPTLPRRLHSLARWQRR